MFFLLRARVLSVALTLWRPAAGLPAQPTSPDAKAAATAVAQFHAALTAGDSARAVALLSKDVLVLESGAVQTRAEYLSHHLGADMKASNGSKAVRSIVQVQLMGEAAYVVSKSVTPPTGGEGSSGSEMAELMVLSKTPSGWSIRAVHWSSRRKRS
ncbi:nuclear transport factor 2 family protein [Gemmatimonas sp.]|jgi:ketosteroid isomerase-like protein|uniref:nuclear transport factor 2 family protein n=1 Tax=Gemmatimonas sp. TaxID=1962908 RepID=UPI0022BF7828|nr:nuclear transport factor 2 family protein [Gemmatimonas sp.]MCZ8013854.1 nuclear transport factor 2 family protein [Gemmatimonas sp.]MCZ8268102.1 nuclear transport factor 2 family protein [Gemmatimonas sp.]